VKKTVLQLPASVMQWERHHAGVILNEHNDMRVGKTAERDHDITLSDFTVDGGMFLNPNDRTGVQQSVIGQAQGIAGISLSRIDRLTLESLEIRNCEAWGLNLSANSDDGWVSNVRVTSLDSHHNKWWGVGVPGPIRGAEFRGCRFNNNSGGFDFDADQPLLARFIEDVSFFDCEFTDNNQEPSEGFGLQIFTGVSAPGGKGWVKALTFQGCRFINNLTHLRIPWLATAKYEAGGVLFRRCTFARAHRQAAYIEGGHGTFDECFFVNNAVDHAQTLRASDLTFFAMDWKDNSQFKDNADVVWTVSNCFFQLSSRQAGPDPRLLAPDGVREAIAVGLIDPIDPKEPRVKRIDMASGVGFVSVTVKGCFVITGAVTAAPNGGKAEAVLVRRFSKPRPKDLSPPLAVAANRSSNGSRDWEWVHNPGMSSDYPEDATGSGRFPPK